MPADFVAPATVHILVVDDVQDNLVLMEELLARPDLRVLVASSGAKAIELLADAEVALALLDVHMPDINGFKLAEQMRRSDRTRGVPIIFLTGDGRMQSRAFVGYEAGAVDFLIKPIDAHMLQSKVRVFVDLYRYRQELSQQNAELQRLLAHNEALAWELREAHRQAVHESHTDALTGVSNRRYIMQLGEATLGDRRQQSHPVSLAVLDLDHFKAINDERGHSFGDAVLSAFCQHVNRRIRPPSVLGRVGGEEFLLLMPGTPLAEAEVVLERIHRTLQPLENVAYSFSAGLAQAGDGELLQSVISRADHALYEAKRAGRDCSITSHAPLSES